MLVASSPCALCSSSTICSPLLKTFSCSRGRFPARSVSVTRAPRFASTMPALQRIPGVASLPEAVQCKLVSSAAWTSSPMSDPWQLGAEQPIHAPMGSAAALSPRRLQPANRVQRPPAPDSSAAIHRHTLPTMSQLVHRQAVQQEAAERHAQSPTRPQPADRSRQRLPRTWCASR